MAGGGHPSASWLGRHPHRSGPQARPHACGRTHGYDLLVIATGARPAPAPAGLGPPRRAPPAHARRRRPAAGGICPWLPARDRRRGADRRRGRVDGSPARHQTDSDRGGPGTARARLRRRDRCHAGRALAGRRRGRAYRRARERRTPGTARRGGAQIRRRNLARVRSDPRRDRRRPGHEPRGRPAEARRRRRHLYGCLRQDQRARCLRMWRCRELASPGHRRRRAGGELVERRASGRGRGAHHPGRAGPRATFRCTRGRISSAFGSST